MESGVAKNIMSIDDFKLWKTNSLKNYLYVRGKSNEGSFDDLVARAYAAHYEGLKPLPELEETERTQLDEYISRLMIDDDVLPDPMTMKEGWFKEKDRSGENHGILRWPSIYYVDIASFVGLTQPDFLKRLKSEYKQGKCYRYFANDFVRDIFYHPVSETSKVCILKCKVVPSQRLSNKPYDVWCVVEKDTEAIPGGEIKSAYCSCTAGLGNSCNHLIAMLFRIEYAVKNGFTKPSSTSKICEWNVPTAMKNIDVKGKKIEDIFFHKDEYMKDPMSKKKLIETKKKFDQFSPLWHEKCKHINDQAKTRQELYALIKEDIKGSCLWEMVEGRSLARELQYKDKSIICPTIPELASTFLSSNPNITHEHYEKFIDTIKFTDEQRLKIKKLTVHQSSSDTWFAHREGRLTASNFHRIFTRSKNLQKLEPNERIEASKAIIKDLMGYNPKFQPEKSHALKYGIYTEPEAKLKYKSIMTKKHRGFVTNESGLVIDREIPYLAASPDLEISCDCCGDGLLEIKCPASIKQCWPTSENYKYLSEVVTETGIMNKLKLNTAYFFQIQGQMGVTGRKYCDFFVYTKIGYHLEHIEFDQNIWNDIKEKLQWFWKNIICHELLFKTIKNDNATNKSLTNIISEPLSINNTTPHVININVASTSNIKNVLAPNETTSENIDFHYFNNSKDLAQNDSEIITSNTSLTTPKKLEDQTCLKQLTSIKIMKEMNIRSVHKRKATEVKRQTKKSKTLPQTYFCGVCKEQLVNEPKTYDESSIGCDSCRSWFHFNCVGLSKSFDADNNKWYCCNCNR